MGYTANNYFNILHVNTRKQTTYMCVEDKHHNFFSGRHLITRSVTDTSNMFYVSVSAKDYKRYQIGDTIK